MEKRGRDAVARAIKTLGTTDGRLIEEIAEKLYENRDKADYIESSKECLEEQKVGNRTVLIAKALPLENPARIFQKNMAEKRIKSMNDNKSKASDNTIDSENNNSISQKNSIPHSQTNESFGQKTYVQNQAQTNNNNITVQVNIAGEDIISQPKASKLLPVDKIRIFDNKVVLKPNEEHELEVLILPRRAQGTALSYVSLDTDIATVSQDGVITAKSQNGATTVIVQAGNGVTSKVDVVVQEKNMTDDCCPPTQNMPVKIFPGWGPERPTFTNESPASYATFNSITNNAMVGDERDFVRIVDKSLGKGGVYSSEIEIEPGKDYEVFIYYHNNASNIYNTAKFNYVGVADQVRLMTNFPMKLAAGERGIIYSEITSRNAKPKAVWDEVCVTAKENLTLHYVLASARIYNDWGISGTGLSSRLFSKEGTYLGVTELNGIILGGPQYLGYVVYTLRAIAEEQPKQ